MFDLFNTSYAKLSSHVAISDSQKEYFKKEIYKLHKSRVYKIYLR